MPRTPEREFEADLPELVLGGLDPAAAAMYVPFLALFLALWLGLIDSGTMVVAGHVLMLPAMAGVMLLRPHEYVHGHGERTHR